jgi:hypothetical protein
MLITVADYERAAAESWGGGGLALAVGQAVERHRCDDPGMLPPALAGAPRAAELDRSFVGPVPWA